MQLSLITAYSDPQFGLLAYLSIHWPGFVTTYISAILDPRMLYFIEVIMSFVSLSFIKLCQEFNQSARLKQNQNKGRFKFDVCTFFTSQMMQ